MSRDENGNTTPMPLRDNGLEQSSRAFASNVMGKSKLYLIPLFMLTLFTGAVIGMYFQPPGLRIFFNATGLEPGAGTETPIAVAIQKVSSQEEIAVVSEGDVVALGRIIPRGDVIRVATPSGAGDARIAEIRVVEGNQVQANDVLAILDNLPQLESRVVSAQASIGVREANLLQTRASIRASLDETQAGLERAEATAKMAQSDLSRATSLFERDLVTRADFDRVIARANEAGRDVERNIATLSRYETGSEIVQADIAVAEANLQAARAELARARQDLEGAFVRAPVAGTVLDINAHVGERPANTGIFDLGDTSQMTVEAEVYQTMIGRVAIGDPVTASAGALREELSGIVSAIGMEIGRQSITSDDPAANTDARVVDVIIMLDAASSDIARRFTNLETIVRIDAGRAE
ncbi:ABC transporter permease (plasmid) [Sulfitobacter sp. SK012]|uniref:HlyD family efflux transporter periplasmic adaptor subunit n=1 Tax=Sulfitobacter sp. SK012 TaxID=1389005 RepID=UPI000E0A4AC6|nr:HlyD family efflux transporter periplasmic adaptor subunit [Sulfitobacter sp. SK012]AXI49183.1 ABC transporter permease [Sulfitobacter sp. SK012]